MTVHMESEKRNTEQEVIAFISETLSVAPEAVSTNSLLSDLSEDSIKLFELLIAFEQQYEVETEYEEVVNLHTVGDVIAYAQKLLQDPN